MTFDIILYLLQD